MHHSILSHMLHAMLKGAIKDQNIMCHMFILCYRLAVLDVYYLMFYLFKKKKCFHNSFLYFFLFVALCHNFLIFHLNIFFIFLHAVSFFLYFIFFFCFLFFVECPRNSFLNQNQI